MTARAIIWARDNWFRATPFLLIYALVLLLVYRRQMELGLWLIWLHTPIYFLHQFEEYLYPGGFLAFFNKYNLGSDNPEFPLTTTAALWINVPVIFVAYPVSALLAGPFGLSVGLWVVYFSLVNGLAHLAMYFRHGYNPGLAVSCLANIPVGLFTIGYFWANGLTGGGAHLVGALVAIGLHAGLIIYGFLVLKPKIPA